MRGSLAGVYAPERAKRRKNRRRYDIALGTNGAEMRLPSLPRLAIGWRLVSGMMVLALGAILYLAWNAPMLKVDALQVDGLRRLKSADLNAVVDVTGKPIFLVDQDKMLESLQAAFPELLDLSVEVKIPARVIVRAVERRPVLAWTQDGRTLWVDAEGVTFPVRGEVGELIHVEAESLPASPPVMVEEGEESEAAPAKPAAFTLPTTLVEAIQEVKEEAPENTSLLYSNRHGLGWKDSRGWQAYFGTDIQDMDAKLKVYKALVQELRSEDIQPVMISVEHLHAPFYRLEQ
jgi:cell division septal protein FtsQ